MAQCADQPFTEAVGGCELHVENDPGNLQFDWLDVQLRRFRDKGMQVILLGHVPPTPGNYFPDCVSNFILLYFRLSEFNWALTLPLFQHFRYGQTAIR
jgi:hypothetical protein